MIEPAAFLRPDWPAPARVRAACTTRLGGVSSGPHAAMNVGDACGDDPAAVSENRRRLVDALTLPQPPQYLRQVHGRRAVRLPDPAPIPEADAAWTDQPGIVCAVQAADCLPVLFCDREAQAVAAAHAGWRGLAGGVLEATVAALPVPPSRLLAWLGPAIGPAAFEVGDEVVAAFCDPDPGALSAFSRPKAGGKANADLYALARRRLAQVGVAAVYGGGLCTVGDPARFHSYRRDGRCGRMAALIWIDGE